MADEREDRPEDRPVEKREPCERKENEPVPVLDVSKQHLADR